MKLSIYQIDAFATGPFTGNPAAVIPLDEWLPAATMQAIAEENNLSETAFFVPENDAFHIRWFTPLSEVDLCGHATLASAFVILNILKLQQDAVAFTSLSGPLRVTQSDQLLTLDFPAQPATRCDIPNALVEGLGATPSACLQQEDYIAVFEQEEDVLALEPDHPILQKLDLRGVIATAPAGEYDFVVRFFAPKLGIPEDPVTGSAYTKLAPYWSQRFGKAILRAKQCSKRGGEVICEHQGDRVLISGHAVKYLEGEIDICL